MTLLTLKLMKIGYFKKLKIKPFLKGNWIIKKEQKR
jgi:hypothetical protein